MPIETTIFDTAVWGGGMTGICAAVAAARQGDNTVLITRESFLGDELTAALRPWIAEEGREELGEILALVFSEHEGYAAETPKIGKERWYRNGDLKRDLLALLDAAGVKVLFQSAASGVLTDEQEVCGLLLANAFGTQLLRCRRVIDASQNGDLLAMVGEASERQGAFGRKMVLAFRESIDGDLPQDAVVRVTPWDFRMYVELAVPDGVELQKAMYQVMCSAPFRKQMLLQASQRSWALAESHLKLSRNYRNLSRVSAGMEECISFGLLNRWECLGGEAAEVTPFGDGAMPEHAKILSGSVQIPLTACRQLPFRDAGLGLTEIVLDTDCITRAHTCQVAVAGGGTAGTAAALAAALQGAEVIVTEQFAGLGGTQTIGLVSGYYHGYVNGFAGLDTARMQYETGLCGAMGRQLWYAEQLRKHGVTTLMDTIVCGVLQDGAQVQGLLCADSAGLFCIRAEVTVDSTGDSTVTDFAGVRSVLGAERDGILQDCSQWEIRGRNTDLDVINPTSYAELLRGIRLAHTQDGATDFCPMLTQRESRRFEGEYTITMRDVLRGAWYADGICIGETDCDPHGAMSSLYSYMGLTPYHGRDIQVLVPYRACIPKGVDGLLVASKGISAEQDAAAYLRMAADVQNRGYALGTAAALAVQEGVAVREVDLSRLREIMIHMQILPTRWRDAHAPKLTAQAAVEGLARGQEEFMLAVLCLEAAEALPLLREAYEETPGDDLAIALAWFGDGRGLPRLRDALKELNLQEQDGQALYCDAHPLKPGNHKGGILQEREPYWKINQILTVMGMMADSACLPEVIETAAQAEPGGSPERTETAYVMGRIDLYKVPWMDRIRCICFCAEQMPDARWTAPLEALLEQPHMGGFAERGQTTGVWFQRAYLELVLARTLAYCGSERGLKLLRTFADCENGVLSSHAQEEYRRITQTEEA